AQSGRRHHPGVSDRWPLDVGERSPFSVSNQRVVDHPVRVQHPVGGGVVAGCRVDEQLRDLEQANFAKPARAHLQSRGTGAGVGANRLWQRRKLVGRTWRRAVGVVVVLVTAGAFLTERLNKFPLVLTFLATYFGLFTIAS